MEPYLGQISLFAFGKTPQGWHVCDGTLLLIATNQALYSVIGKSFGGDGIKNFALPDLRGRVPLGAVGLSGTKPYGYAVADGQEAVTLTATQLPAHDHALQASNTLGTSSSVKDTIYAAVGAQLLYAPMPATPFAIDASSFAAVGAGAAHDNMQPYMALNYCIALAGVYPPRP